MTIRLKTISLWQLATIMLLLISSLAIRAETALVFMDNSRSIDDLQHVYRHDIEVIMGVSSYHSLYFAAIGESGPERGCRQMLSSELSKDEQQKALQDTFRFTDWHTPIYNSLAHLESCDAFQEAKQILIISDMEPDHQRTAGRWNFDRNDLSDVKKTHELLKKWVKQGKQLTIVLHGWERKPQRDEHYINEKDSFTVLWKQQNRKARGNKFVREPERNKKLVALSLVELDEQFPKETVRLFEMPLTLNGYANHEGLRQVFCGTLPISKPQAARVCFIETSKDFTLAIDISPRLSLSGYYDQLREQVTSEEFIGPLRMFQVEKDSLKRNRRGMRKTSQFASEVDFYFQVYEGKSGQAYWYPILKTFAKDADGQWHTLKEILRQDENKKLQSKKKATRWIASRINQALKAIVSQYYPPSASLKTIFLLNPDGTRLTGEYQFSAYYRFDQKQPEEQTEQRVVDQGVVELSIPKVVRYAKLYMKDKGFEDGRYELGDLPLNLINSSQSINFSIPKKRKITMSIQLEGEVPHTTSIEFFLLGEIKTSVYRHPHKQTQTEVSFLPSKYYWEAIPVNDDRILGLSGHKILSSPKQSSEEQTLSILFRHDPLANSEDWATEIDNMLDSDEGILTTHGRELISGSAYFFRALLDYTSLDYTSSRAIDDDLKNRWRQVREHYEGLSTDRQRLLKRSLLMLGLKTDNQGNLIPEALRNIDIMFDMMIKGRSSTITGQTAQVIKARLRYRRWIKHLSRRQYISRELAQVLKG